MTAIAPERRLKPTPAAVALAKKRIEERRAREAERAAPTVSRGAVPDDLAEDIELAEVQKHPGELPVPRSTFTVMPARGDDLAHVEELDRRWTFDVEAG